MAPAETMTVLHYVGYDVDRGGILAHVRALAGEKRFACVLGVNEQFQPVRSAALPLLRLPVVAGDVIGLANAWRARRVADEVQAWLRADPRRIFHGHSRAGLLVALWLHARGERRVLATVHAYGRQTWFYRWAARRLGERMLWLHPAMKRYYGIETNWDDCVPPGVAAPGHDSAQPQPPPRPSGATVRFGCVGALVPVKQWELVLEALARVPVGEPIAVVHAGSVDTSAGSARYAAGLRQLVAARGLQERWEWRGEVADMAKFYGEVDCLVIAAEREAFSLAAIEAARAGVSTLVADTAGISELVTSSGLGWTFQANSADALAARMRELARGDALRRPQVDAAVLRAFTPSVVAARHEVIYRALLAS